MKKKEIKEEEKKGIFSTNDTLWLANDNTIDDIWLLSLLALILFDKPKKESNTTINIYTGSDK